MNTTTEKRDITILVRYEILKDHGQYRKGTVILVCRNDQDEEYTVTLRLNKHHSCTCLGYVKGHRACYHVAYCRAVENDQRATRNARKAERKIEREKAAAVMALQKEVNRICEEAAAEQLEDEKELVAAASVPAARSAEKATLSSNKPFSFMRV
jgi:hypothetical protein